MTVNADGSLNITDNGGSITVDGTVTTTATDLDIRDLSHTQDSVKIGDGTDLLAVNADGSINVAFAAGAEIKITDGTDDLAVNADGSINSVVTSTDLDIRDLAFATDKVDVTGSTVELGATTLAALETINVTDGGGSLTVDAVNLDIRDLAFATDKVDVSGSSVSITGDVNVTQGTTPWVVSATDLDVRDLSHAQDSVKIGDGTDFLAVNTDGSINVKISDGSPGTEVTDYDTDAALAGGATGTHTYTSTGNFYLQQIEASGSGKMKIVVKVNAVTKYVMFNSTATPNMSITLAQPILATTGQTVTVERTNRENQAMDVYSTISGYLA